MRMRHKAWARPELDASLVYVKNPEEYRGRWREAFPEKQPLALELGCGKGVFLSLAGPAHPEINYLGIDIKSEVLGNAKRNLERAYGGPDCHNVRITARNIERIDTILSPRDRVCRIYINFCNPWPKHKHHKHRLTYPTRLTKYREFLPDGGKIWFKTDDDGLFRDSVKYFEGTGFKIGFLSHDLSQSPFPEDFTTEYQEKFARQGIKIKGLWAEKLPGNFEACAETRPLPQSAKF